MRIGPTRVEVTRNFATKLWNAARFCEMNECIATPGFDPAAARLAVNQWIVAEIARASAFVEGYIVDLRFNEAAGSVYHFVYDIFCDWYLEIAKPIFAGGDEAAKVETRATAAWARDYLLAMLHPFMPFITEELWARTAVPDGRANLLIEAMWPAIKSPPAFEIAQRELEWVIELVKGVRSVRAEMNVPPSAKIDLLLTQASTASQQLLDRHKDVIVQLARLAGVAIVDDLPKGSAQFVLGEAMAGLPLGDVIDFAQERARLEKDLRRANEEIARFDAKLSNEQFVSRAPEDVLAEQRDKRGEAAALASRLKDAIARLA
jgi:valyl-tRNA synthetase